MTTSLHVQAASPVSRRTFIVSSTLALGALALGGTHRSEAAAPEPTKAAKPVLIVSFDNTGKRLQAARLPKVVKSDAQWRRQLSPLSFQVTRRAGTERAGTGALLKLKAKGVYRCICCDTALFNSSTKYESGTGWPSFWRPIARENVVEHRDTTLGMVRTEVVCARCDAHLGHVFDDGPRPTGLRYCMNSAALKFDKA